jgi:trehalose-6-phosphate synthase
VDRYLEARIEHEHSTIAFREKETLVESYPISIAWPSDAEQAEWPAVADCRQRVRERLQLPPGICLAVGVDRFDYTKGILERLNAVERLLEKYPEWIGRFVFVQVAAPTRSALEEYRSFQDRIQRAAERINGRFTQDGITPVHLLAWHHEHDAINELFRAADICLVTSLHDGMNLVCKEFVAARDDLQGVLVLSRFAGAARELPEALIVNPYHVEETADALHRAARMPQAEQRERMASLRGTVREFNVYRWAGRLLADAGRWRARAHRSAGEVSCARLKLPLLHAATPPAPHPAPHRAPCSRPPAMPRWPRCWRDGRCSRSTSTAPSRPSSPHPKWHGSTRVSRPACVRWPNGCR